MNREPAPNSSGAANQPSAADDAVAGVNLDDLGDLGPKVPVETSTSEPNQSNESEALAETVRHALKEDAMTYWLLEIKVEVVDGVVRLHGQVDYYEDAEAAEAVASRVPGVRYVQDDLAIARMQSDE
jgi:osmotically-inducible protein OsmY